MCLKIYELDNALFLIAPGLAWHAALEKTKVKLYLLTDISMLLMVEKGIRGGIYHAVYQQVKAYNKYMKVYDKNKESSYLKYQDVINLYGWPMSQMLPLGCSKQIDKTSRFNENFTKNYNDDSEEGYFLEYFLVVQKKLLLRIDLTFTMIYLSYLKG